MKAKYDAEVDVLTVSWSDRAIEESDSVSPGVILDFDQGGNVIGIEILNASRKIENFSPAIDLPDNGEELEIDRHNLPLPIVS